MAKQGYLPSLLVQLSQQAQNFKPTNMARGLNIQLIPSAETAVAPISTRGVHKGKPMDAATPSTGHTDFDGSEKDID